MFLEVFNLLSRQFSVNFPDEISKKKTPNPLKPLTLKSLSSLLGDFFRDFWPGFLALDQNRDGTDGTDGRADGRDGRTGGRTGRTDGIQFYSTTGTEKYSITVAVVRSFPKEETEQKWQM